MSGPGLNPGPAARSVAPVEAEVAQAIAADEGRIARELVDTVVRDLFGVGLTLQRALAQMSGPAVEPVNHAVDAIDRIIRSIRVVVFRLADETVTDTPERAGRPH